MKKTSNIIVILSTILIVIGVIAGSLTTNYSSQISSIVTTITAIIGAVALWFQFRKDRAINQASFSVEFYETFQQNTDANSVVLAELDKKYDGKEYKPLKEMPEQVISYLTWVRCLCSLIERKVLDYESVDDMFAYKFFAIVNNKEVQEMELGRLPSLYKPFYRVHKAWNEYRRKKGESEICAEESLSRVKDYDKYAQKR